MELSQTKRKCIDTFEVIERDYKVIATVETEEGVIKHIRGTICKDEEIVEDTPMRKGTSWYAEKLGEKWGTRIEWVANDEHPAIVDIVVKVVNNLVARYE
jgi:hypothetical protein